MQLKHRAQLADAPDSVLMSQMVLRHAHPLAATDSAAATERRAQLAQASDAVLITQLLMRHSKPLAATSSMG